MPITPTTRDTLTAALVAAVRVADASPTNPNLQAVHQALVNLDAARFSVGNTVSGQSDLIFTDSLGASSAILRAGTAVVTKAAELLNGVAVGNVT